MKKKNRIAIDKFASFLLIVGALAWGVYALGANVVELLLGTGILSSIVFGLVGLAGLWTLFRKPLTGKRFMN